MEVKSFGAFLVILVKLATPPLPPQQSWILNKMSEIICWAGGGGGEWEDGGRNPKWIKKLLLAAEFYVTIT